MSDMTMVAAIRLMGYSKDQMCPHGFRTMASQWPTNKQLLRGMEMRTYDTLEKGIATALDLVCANDAQGGFKNCGYRLFQKQND